MKTTILKENGKYLGKIVDGVTICKCGCKMEFINKITDVSSLGSISRDIGYYCSSCKNFIEEII